MPVHGVNAVKQGNPRPRFERSRLVTVIEIGPRLQVITGLRVGIAAAQKRSEVVSFNVVKAFQKHLVRLCHLPHFFFERQRGEKSSNLGIERREARCFRRGGQRVEDWAQASPRHGGGKRLSCRVRRDAVALGLGAVFMAVSPGSDGVLGRVRRAVDKTRGRPERVDGPLLGFLAGGWLALVGAWKLAGWKGEGRNPLLHSLGV